MSDSTAMILAHENRQRIATYDYSDLHQTEWKRKRDKVLAHADYRCQICGANADAVHHSYYLTSAKAWEYPDGALIAVCHDCHGRIIHGLTTAPTSTTESEQKSEHKSHQDKMLYLEDLIIEWFPKIGPINLLRIRNELPDYLAGLIPDLDDDATDMWIGNALRNLFFKGRIHKWDTPDRALADDWFGVSKQPCKAWNEYPKLWKRSSHPQP